MKSSISTRFFGSVEFTPEEVIYFPAGIAPFVTSQRFVIISEEKKRPLLFLQSVDDETLCFITIPIRVFDPEYQLNIEDHDLELLGWKRDRKPTLDDLSCVAILTIPENGAVTGNLLGPLVFDVASRLGVQAVRTDRLYGHAHPLGEPLRAGVAACSS
jgi:flagellar assembly factor FliW